MFPNLEAEMARNGIKRAKLAKEIGMSYSTLGSKMNGKGIFTLPDMKKIKAAIGTTLPMEILFDEEKVS